MSEPFDFSKLYSKQRKSELIPKQYIVYIHRGNISFPVGNSDSNSRKNKKVSFCSIELMQRSESSQRLSSSVRHNGIMSGIDTHCSSLHEIHSYT